MKLRMLNRMLLVKFVPGDRWGKNTIDLLDGLFYDQERRW